MRRLLIEHPVPSNRRLEKAMIISKSFPFKLGLLLMFFATITPGMSFGDVQAASRAWYQSPLPGAKYVSPEERIIIRPGMAITGAILNTPDLFVVVGSTSGRHPGRVILSDDHRTLIFAPESAFAPGESVHVQLNPELLKEPVARNATSSFSFVISAHCPFKHDPMQFFWNEVGGFKGSGSMTQYPAATDTLPIDFPNIQSTIYGSPASGRLFLSNLRFSGSYVPYLMIVDDNGAPIFHRKMGSSCFDFKLQQNGLLTYYDSQAGRFMALNDSYGIVDSFACGNGYTADLHELIILPDDHALLMSYDPQPVDMSGIVPGGDPNATVIGLIIQELDSEKNVVFQWRSWDHFQITDATHEDLTAASIDYVHGNALDLDSDGNILLSSRHMDEITKIDRQTGEIIWRWGGKNNQFTFINDSLAFSHQHAIRRIANGNLTMFDNGNFHSPPFSRAVEYQVDETNKTATLVWEYRNSTPTYGLAMGYVQRFDNGNTLIGWGATNPTITEVAPDGSKVFELTFDQGMYSYRAFRYDWQPDTTPPASGIPTAISISQNYPNPFNGTTKLVVNLPEESTFSVKIYDIIGREVMTVADGVHKTPGSYILEVDASGLASGTYFCRLVTPRTSETRRMVLIK